LFYFSSTYFHPPGPAWLDIMRSGASAHARDRLSGLQAREHFTGRSRSRTNIRFGSSCWYTRRWYGSRPCRHRWLHGLVFFLTHSLIDNFFHVIPNYKLNFPFFFQLLKSLTMKSTRSARISSVLAASFMKWLKARRRFGLVKRKSNGRRWIDGSVNPPSHTRPSSLKRPSLFASSCWKSSPKIGWAARMAGTELPKSNVCT
jgi:hypothetical protein